MRLALMIAAAGATGRLGGTPRELLQQGVKRLAASPELGKITESVRGELLDAARSAAMTAASSRIDSLNDRLQSTAGRGGKARDEEQPEDEDYLDVEEEPEAEEAEEPEEAEDTEELEDTEESGEPEEPEPEEEEEPEPPRRRRAAAGRSSTGRSTQGRATRTRATQSRGRAPVRRTGR
ncbi:hypothetical protein [Prauserella flavalba]|nr:hypothetical protein [Prauserella flavalba]